MARARAGKLSATAAQSTFTMDPKHLAALREGLFWPSTRPAALRPLAARSTARTCPARRAPRRSSRTTTRPRAGRRYQGREGPGDLRGPAGSCSSPREITPKSRAWCSRNIRNTVTSRRPIAKHVMETCFAKKEGRPLPVYKAPVLERRVIGTPAPTEITPARGGGR